MNDSFLDKDAVEFLGGDELGKLIEPYTPFGKRYLEKMNPYLPGEEKLLIEHFNRLRVLERETDICINDIIDLLQKFRNISESLRKLSTLVKLTPVDFFELKRFVFYFRKFFIFISAFNKSFELYGFQSLDSLWNILDPERSGNYFFSIDSDYAKELRDRYSKIKNSQKKILKKLSSFFEKNFEIPLNGRTEFIIPRNDLRITALLNSKDLLIKKEGSFSITFEIKGNEDFYKLESSLSLLEEEMKREEGKYLSELQKNCHNFLEDIFSQVDNIAVFDVDISGLVFKKKYSCCYPNIDEKNSGFKISEGINLILKEECKKNNTRYDTLTASFSEGSNLIIGANMGGKTTALKTIGQIVYLMQMGFCVPAEKLESKLFSRIDVVFRGNEEKGLSGFGTEVKRALKTIDSKDSLNLFDEFGSGTNPVEGEELALRFVRFFNKKKDSCSIFVTHFPKTINETSNVFQTGNLNVKEISQEISLEDIQKIIDHKLYKFDNNKFPFFAFEIAKMLGIPKEILNNN